MVSPQAGAPRPQGRRRSLVAPARARLAGGVIQQQEHGSHGAAAPVRIRADRPDPVPPIAVRARASPATTPAPHRDAGLPEAPIADSRPPARQATPVPRTPPREWPDPGFPAPVRRSS